MTLSSLKNFIIINFTLVVLGLFKLCFCYTFDFTVLSYIVSEIIVTTLQLTRFEQVNKPWLSHSYSHLDNNERFSATLLYFVMNCSLKGLTHYFIHYTFVIVKHCELPITSITSIINYISNPLSVVYYYLYFVCVSFVLEIIYDFCHYCLHRYAHSNVFVYKYIHKTHHLYANTSAITTFYMSPIDLIISYSVPLFICVGMGMCFKLIDLTFISMFTIYLTYQEIGGHLGKSMYPTSSFAQFIWLPRLLGIQLYTEDHALHHTKINCNYSKRFSLFDLIFGTYKSGIAYRTSE